jgi:hypothetical protein
MVLTLPDLRMLDVSQGYSAYGSENTVKLPPSDVYLLRPA